MPSLDAYLGLQLDDEDGIDVWLMAHRFRHHAYNQAATSLGVQSSNYDFGSDNYPDDDWFNRHMNAHLFLQTFIVPDQSTSLNILQQYTWGNDSDFQTWMQMHTLIHRKLDESFGIF